MSWHQTPTMFLQASFVLEENAVILSVVWEESNCASTWCLCPMYRQT